MPTFSAVAANLVQTPSSTGPAATAAPSQSTESFSSHLQAATGKQQSRAQNSAESSQDDNAATNQAPSVQTDDKTMSALKEKSVPNRDNSKKKTDSPENPQETELQSSPTEPVTPSQDSGQQVQEEVVNASTSENNSKESVMGQMLSAISNAPQRNSTEFDGAQITAKSMDTATTINSGEQTLPPQNRFGADAQTQISQGSVWHPLDTESKLSAESTQTSTDAPAAQTRLVPERPASVTTTIIFNPNDGSITLTNLESQPGLATAMNANLEAQPASATDMNASLGNQPASATVMNANLGNQPASATDMNAKLGNQPASTPNMAADQEQQQAGDQQNDADEPLLVQNRYGQIITIEQSKAATRSPMAATGVAGQQMVHQEANKLDFNGRYIHAHLAANETGGAKVAGHTGNAATNSEQSQSGLFGGGNQETRTMQTSEQTGGIQDPTTPQPTNGSQLSFGFQLNNVQNSTTASGMLSTAGSSYQLGSGTFVPDNTVVEQIAAHFSVNKRLETGTVNLKLHPQELGELRMEIKVEHDNIKAHIVAQSPHAQEMIDRHMPRLREALEQQGLHLHEIEVTVADNNNEAGELFQNNQAWQQSQHSNQRKNIHSDFTLEQDEEVAEVNELNDNFQAIA